MFKRGIKTAAILGMVTAAAAPALADSFELTGVVRDLKRGDQGGHPDFQTAGSMGRFGHVKGLVAMYLGDDGKPVYNADNRPEKDTINSADSLHSWYNDVPGVNVSQPLKIDLDNGQESEGGIYTYSSNSFFPINGHLLGNQGLPYNFHFTYELHTKFTYQPGQVFTFTGDDDVWVYIDGIRVIDIGGVHSAVNGSVLLFDGKVFVDKNDFPLSQYVQEVSNSMRDQLAARWEKLGLHGSLPIGAGDRYVDLDLTNGGPDVRVDFNSSSVTARAAEDLTQVVVRFADGTTQTFGDLQASSGTFSGTGSNAGKSVLGVWVQTVSTAAGGGQPDGTYFDVGGSGFDDKKLDFFFAERHTTQSNFRIDTNMRLEPLETQTISALYD